MTVTQLAPSIYWGKIPDEWQLVPIKYGFGLIGSGTTPPTGKEEYFEGAIPWVTTSELRENFITSTSQTLSESALEEFSALKLFPKGTVLIAMYGATIGRVAMLDITACVNQAVCAMTEPICFEPRYVFYALQASRDYLLSLASGGGQPNLNAEKIRDHELPCPSLTQQRAIAQYLDRQTAKIDTLIIAKQYLLELLAEKRRALIIHTVTRGLNSDVPMRDSGIEWLSKIPEHWEVCPLKYLSNSSGGSTPDRGRASYWDGYIPWVTPKDMKQLYIGESLENITELAIEETSIRVIDPPAILVVVRGMILAHSFPVAISTAPVTINQDMKAFCFFKEVCIDFIAMQILARRDEILSTIREAGHGTKALETEFLKNLIIMLPPLNEQKKIVSYIESKISKLDALRKTTEQTIALLQKRRTALISAAVIGQIRVLS